MCVALRKRRKESESGEVEGKWKHEGDIAEENRERRGKSADNLGVERERGEGKDDIVLRNLTNPTNPNTRDRVGETRLSARVHTHLLCLFQLFHPTCIRFEFRVASFEFRVAFYGLGVHGSVH